MKNGKKMSLCLLYIPNMMRKNKFVDALFPYSTAKNKSFSSLPTDYAATLFESLHNLH